MPDLACQPTGSEWEQYQDKPPKFTKRELLYHALTDAISYNDDLASCYKQDDPFLLWLNPLIEQMEALKAKLYPEAVARSVLEASVRIQDIKP